MSATAIPTLYEIGSDLHALEALLTEIGGDITEEAAERAIDAWLAEAHANLKAKADNYCGLIQELSARAKARKEESDRLATRARVDENAAKRLKDRLQFFLEAHDIPKLETARFKLSVQANGGVAPLILDVPADQVPEDFCKVRVEPDNKTIREALDAGKALPFAHLGQRGTSLRIR